VKRLHWLILKSFIGPFLGTFFISMIFLVMQFLWKYIDDLMGKGLDLSIILELLLYASADLIPMAIPLAVLLSTIMVFGKFGELNELTAMKSAGLSLFRIFLPLTVVMLFLSGGAFLFSNYTWPSAHFKMRVLIGDITQQKAALSFVEGQYYTDIENHSIYVGKKLDDTHFEKVIISDLKTGAGYKWRSIYAKNAEITQQNGGSMLTINLFDGFSDEALYSGSMGELKNPYRHTNFDRLKLNMDVSGFSLERTETDGYKESVIYKNYQELTIDVDSLKRTKHKQIGKLSAALIYKLFLFRDTTPINYDTVQSKVTDIMALDVNVRDRVLKIARNTVQQSKTEMTSRLNSDISYYNDLITYINIARNRIFILSVVIIILFFIGAPLGAIAKKGGIGLPVVFAVLLFILYYMLSISGEKMVKENVLSPFWGMWLSSLILTPVAIFLLLQANSDSKLFDKGFYKKLFRRKRS